MMDKKPILLWDGDCSFCISWIARWRKITKHAIADCPYQEGLINYPQVLEIDCKESVQLIMPNGHVFQAGHALLQSLAIAGKRKEMLKLYARSKFFRKWVESTYRFVARNRSWLPR